MLSSFFDMVLSLLFILEPLLYLIVPQAYEEVSPTGRRFQIAGLLFFLVSVIFLIENLLLDNIITFLLFITFFGISYICGVICLSVDPERKKDK